MSTASSEHLPPADQPNWGGKYNWEWFKHHHFDTLAGVHNKLDTQFKQQAFGQAYKYKAISALLNEIDALLVLYPYFPDTGGGQDALRNLKKKSNTIKRSFYRFYLPYMKASRIRRDVFGIYNYMKSMCSEDSY